MFLTVIGGRLHLEEQKQEKNALARVVVRVSATGTEERGFESWPVCKLLFWLAL
jgi:hypothetical protein